MDKAGIKIVIDWLDGLNRRLEFFTETQMVRPWPQTEGMGDLTMRLRRAVANDLGSLQQRSESVDRGRRQDPWAFDTVAASRYLIWADTARAFQEAAIAALEVGDAGRALAEMRRVANTLAAFSAAQRYLDTGSQVTARLAGSGAGHRSPFGQEVQQFMEHVQVYSTPKLPGFEYDQIEAQVLAGRNPLTALDVVQLQLEGVSDLLDLRTEPEWSPPKFGASALEAAAGSGIRRVSIPVGDMMAPTPDALDRAVQFLEQIRTQPDSRVYVHCRAGQERTAAILVADRARRHNLGYDEALAQLRRARPSLKPLPEQERAVRAWLKGRGPW